MSTPPPLLKTYEEARLLFEAKGWGLAKAAEHLSELPEMASFRISHPKLSKRTTPGSKVPIETEVAAAVEGMQTWRGYERQTEIVTAGLRAIHGDPPIVEIDVRQLARDLRECLPANELATKLVEALEEMASAPATRGLFARLARPTWRHVAITAASGAAVAVLLVPLLSAAHAFPTPPASPFVVVVPAIAMDDSPVQLWFEPGALLALADPGGGPKRPAEQQVPKSTLPGQKVAPCDTEGGEVAINGNCWLGLSDVKPPCGHRAFRHGDKCYRPMAADSPRKPAP